MRFRVDLLFRFVKVWLQVFFFITISVCQSRPVHLLLLFILRVTFALIHRHEQTLVDCRIIRSADCTLRHEVGGKGPFARVLGELSDVNLWLWGARLKVLQILLFQFVLVIASAASLHRAHFQVDLLY